MTATASANVRRVHHALSLLRPFDIIGVKKIRLGRSADGGHVLVDVDLPLTQAFTFTNGEALSFEVVLAVGGCQCLLVNHPLSARRSPHPNLAFFNTKPAAPEQPAPTIGQVMADHGLNAQGSTLLKLSSSGNEHLALRSLDREQRRCLTHVIVQVHWLNKLSDPTFREEFISAFEDWNKDFTLYHVHANNHLNIAMAHNYPIADVIELTYIRTDLIRRKASQTAYPTYLDCACDPDRPDLPLSFFPFCPSPAGSPEQESQTQLDNALVSSELIDDLRAKTGLPTALLRMSASTRPILMPEERSVRPPSRRPRFPDGQTLKILYFGCHETLDYDDLCMFTAMGHVVFCLGAFADPNSQFKPATRPVRPEFFSQELWNAFVSDPGNDLFRKIVTPAFAALFDLVIVNHDAHLLDLNREALLGKPIIFRSIGQASDMLEACLARHLDHVAVVRYSPREVGLPNFCPSDRVIYFAKNLSDYPQWQPGSRMITFHNSYAQRSDHSVPRLPQYLSLAERGPLDLYGYLNEKVTIWRGLAPPAVQQQLFQTAGVYFYVYSAPPSYTLSLIEALLSGVPTVVPSAAAARSILGPVADAVGWTEQRYEVEDFVGNDPALIWDTVEEGFEKASALLNDRSHALEVSKRLRERASSMFDYRKISLEWQQLFDEMVGA